MRSPSGAAAALLLLAMPVVVGGFSHRSAAAPPSSVATATGPGPASQRTTLAALRRPPQVPSWRSSPACRSRRHQQPRSQSSFTALNNLPFDEDGPVDVPPIASTSPSAPSTSDGPFDGIYDKPDQFDLRTTVFLVGGQAVLVLVAIAFAAILGTPNLGLGSGFALTSDAIQNGVLATIPLFLLAFVLDFVEEVVPALKDVTMATQRSVLALLGGTFRPISAVGTAMALGAAAGIGEEMLFRGVIQSELTSRVGEWAALGISSVIFGALHAVTPLYALLATVASVYFGSLYVSAENLAVPMVAHGVYDVGALLWAHWTICQLTEGERREVREWISPVEKIKGGGQGSDE